MTEAFAHLNAPIPSATRPRRRFPPASTPSSSGRSRRIRATVQRARGELVGDLRDVIPRRRAGDRRAAASRRRELAADRTERVHTFAGRDGPGSRRSRSSRSSLGGLTAAAFASRDGDEPSVQTDDAHDASRRVVGHDSTFTVTETTTAPEETTRRAGGAELNNEGFARMQAEDYEGALPLLSRRSQSSRARGRWPRRTRATTSRSRASRSAAATACSSFSTAPRRCRATDPRSIELRRESGEAVRRRARKGQGEERRRGRLAEQREHFAVLGEAALGLLREDEPPVRAARRTATSHPAWRSRRCRAPR